MTKRSLTHAAALVAAFALILGTFGACKKKESKSTSSKGGSDMMAAAMDGMKEAVAKDDMGAMAPAKRKAAADPMAPDGMASAKPGPAQAPAPAAGGKPIIKAVVSLNAAKLRKTFLWKTFLGLKPVKKFLGGADWKKFVTDCKINPLETVDEGRLFIASPGKSFGDPTHFGIIAKGRFDATVVLPCMKKLPKIKDVKDGTVAGKKGFSFVDDENKKVFAFPLGKDTVVVATAGLAEQLAAGAPKYGATHIAALDKVKKDALVWLALAEIVIPESDRKGMPPFLAGLTKVAWATVELDNDATNWSLQSKADLGDPAVTGKLVPFLNMMKAQFAKGGGGGMPGFVGPLLQNLKVSAKSAVLEAGISLPEAKIKGLLTGLTSTLLK